MTVFSLLLTKDCFATLSALKLKRSDLYSILAYHPVTDQHPFQGGVEKYPLSLIATETWATLLVRRFYLLHHCLCCSRFVFAFFSMTEIRNYVPGSKHTRRFGCEAHNCILMDTAGLRAPIRTGSLQVRLHSTQLVFLSGILLVRTKSIILDFSNSPGKYNRD